MHEYFSSTNKIMDRNSDLELETKIPRSELLLLLLLEFRLGGKVTSNIQWRSKLSDHFKKGFFSFNISEIETARDLIVLYYCCSSSIIQGVQKVTPDFYFILFYYCRFVFEASRNMAFKLNRNQRMKSAISISIVRSMEQARNVGL